MKNNRRLQTQQNEFQISRHEIARNVASQPYALLATLVLFLAMIGLSSCAGYTSSAKTNPSNPGSGVLSAGSTSVTFGSVAVGGNATQNVTITNTGTATVNVSQATVTGAGFSVTGGNPSASLAVGQSSTVTVQFAPTTAGPASGALTVISDASNSPLMVSLAGTATQAGLSISPSTLTFSNVLVNQSSTQNVTLSNTGTTNVTINLATLSGNEFGLSGLSLPKTIAVGQSLSFNVTFSPTTAGPATGNLTFTDNAPGSPQVVTLAGNAVSQSATLTANPGSVAFGNVAVSGNGQQTVTLTNSGNASTTVSQISATGAGLSVTGIATPQTLTAGQSATFGVKFSPTTAGSATGSISVATNLPNSPMSIALSGTGTAGQAQLTLGTPSVSFGNVNVSSTGTQTVSLTNSGNATLTITSATASGNGFSVSGSFPLTVAAGASASFNTIFTPTTAGSATGSISIVSNAVGSPATVTLSGTGVQGQLTANPGSVNFGSVTTGSNGTQTVTLTNSGTASVTVSSVTTTGTGFSVTGLGAPLTLGAGQSTTFTAQFAPTTAGTATGSISIANNGPGSPLTIALNGTGTQAQLGASPASENFGTVNVGGNNSQTVTLKNSGSASVTISAVNATGTGFSVSGATTPMTIAAGQSASFTAQFAPTGSGNATGSISVVSNAPNSPLTIALSGTGAQSTLMASPASIAFGSVTTGTTNSQTVTLTNSGSASTTISQETFSGAGYNVTGLNLPMTLQANATTTFSVSFDPSAAGSATGAVTITSNASNGTLFIALTGTGVAATRTLSLSGTSLSFGNINDGSSSSQSVSLTNTGNSSVTISAVNASNASFTASGVTAGETLTPNQSVTVTVIFAPTTAGAVSGSVSIASNATNSPATVSVSGTGVAAVQHTVGLNWNASTSTVVGYNVYRGTTSSGPYPTKVASSVASTDYSDSTVASGTTYYYVVTAVDSNNNESAYSNQATAVIP